MKICHLIFSCNRLKYLLPSLNSINNIDFGEHEIYRILVDDYPLTRNNNIFRILQTVYNIDELILNQVNKGLSLSWTDVFTYLKNKGFDYIFHQEDDIIIDELIKIDDLLQLLNADDKIAQITLQRQTWYPWDEGFGIIKDSDQIYNQYRYEVKNEIFSPMASFYSADLLNIDFAKYWGYNLNEEMIMFYLRENLGMYSIILKGDNGRNLITHIGEETKGKRVLEGEPGYEKLKFMDPHKVYTSREGKEIKNF
jgi:hypothetical protein